MIPTILYADPKPGPLIITQTQPLLPTRKRRTLESQEEMTSKRFKSSFCPSTDKPDLSQIELDDLKSLAKYFLQALSLKDFELLGNVLEVIRKAVSLDDHPPIEALIATGICPPLSKLLDGTHSSYPKIQIEASWIFSKIASSVSIEGNAYAIELGVMPKLRDLVLSSDEEVSFQAVWGLANISADENYRDELLKLGLMDTLIARADGKDMKITHIRTMAWLLANLCRGKPYPNFDIVAKALPMLRVFVKVDDDELLEQTLWALSYLSDGDNYQIQVFIEYNIVPDVVKCLGRANMNVVTPCLRTVGNLVTGNDSQTSVVLEAGVLDYIPKLMNSTKKGIKKETCWLMSNILAGGPDHIQQVIDHKEIIDKLLQIVYNYDDSSVKCEALIAITNFTCGASSQQIQFLVGCEVIEMYQSVMESNSEVKKVLSCLEGLDNIMKQGGEYVEKVKDLGCIKQIEQLQNHPNSKVYEKTCAIIETHFSPEA